MLFEATLLKSFTIVNYMELPEWLDEKRTQAQQRYECADTPKLKYGLTIRLSTKGLDLTRKEDYHSEQVITLEHEECEVHNLFDALNLPEVQEYLLSTPVADRTVFDDYTDAFFDIGLVVIVPEGKSATLDLTRTLTSERFTEHLLIIAKKNSSLTVIDKYHSEDATVRAGTVEVVCEDDAHVRFSAIQSLTNECFEFASYRARLLGKQSRVDWFVATFGSGLTHANIDTTLKGEGSNARSYGVFLGDEKQQFDLSASSFHKANHSYSDMYTRGVLFGKAKAVYRGNIDIDSQAFECNGYQTEEVLLLSPDAVADAIPNLEIRNNEVKCSHGATIGRIDDEHLFYLQSRGLTKEQATKMIVEGFFEPLTAKLEWPELFEVITPLVQERVS